jgi:beta-lactamase class D
MLVIDAKSFLIILMAGAIMYSLYVSAEERIIDFEKYFSPHEYGCVSVYDTASGRWQRYNPVQCAQRLSPASTFKIFNALVGLETSVLDGPDTMLRWDGMERELDEWNRDHTLRTAVRDSVVWYFQDVASMVGKGLMQHYIDAAGYGNRDISSGIDSFWLDGSLAISADEQVRFIDRLLKYDAPFSHRNVDIVRELLRQDSYGYSDLYGKTGTVILDNGVRVGWYVGWVEREQGPLIFSLNLMGTSGVSGQAARRTVLSILEGEGLMPLRTRLEERVEN